MVAKSPVVPSAASPSPLQVKSQCRECSSHCAAWFPEKGGIQLHLHTWSVPQWQHLLPLQLPGVLAIFISFSAVAELRYLKNDFSVTSHDKTVSKDAFVPLGTNLPWMCLPSHFGACLSLYFLACSCLQPSEAHRTQCLCLALADILWRAGGHEKALVALWVGEALSVPAHCYCTSVCPKSTSFTTEMLCKLHLCHPNQSKEQWKM